MAKKLQVNNLSISFRTVSGKVQAVRGINLDLEQGETLAIVGESGSGKSVTSKAILGILAGNSIIEGGEIMYDGKDLLKIPEEEFHKIRGDKIAMIFQDPLSSLNPIVRIGKQLTEAMLLKNKLSRKMGRVEFNTMLEHLNHNIKEAVGENGVDPKEIDNIIKTFDKFNIEAIKFENGFNTAYARAEELIAEIDDKLFLISKRQKVDVKGMFGSIAKKLDDVKDYFLTVDYDNDILAMKSELLAAKASYVAPEQKEGEPKPEIPASVSQLLNKVRDLLTKVTATARPDFLRIGYYKYRIQQAVIARKNLEELDEKALRISMDEYMTKFRKLEHAGVVNSFNKSLANKKALLPAMAEAREFFLNTDFTKADANKKVVDLSKLVKDSIDPLQFNKDSFAYTFQSSMNAMVNKYFDSIANNAKEEKRYAKQKAKHDAIIAKGKNADWKVIPKLIYDVNELKAKIVRVIDRLVEKYENDIAIAADVNFDEMSAALLQFFQEKASQVVYRVTPKMAKEKAIKLMEEVGISEPRTRYYQYPFEFSGGMRQRIVIAIALAANPDILICDEPTTALDVTIQAQILELINKLKAERNLSVIFITHDLGVVANMADKIAVMYAGKIVEQGTAEDIFYDPKHPYTWALLSSMPDLDTNEKLEAIPGTPPNMIYPPVGDAFAERNKYALKIDFEQEPPMFKVSDTHYAATWLLHPEAPQVEMPKIIRERIAKMNAKGDNQNG